MNRQAQSNVGLQTSMDPSDKAFDDPTSDNDEPVVKARHRRRSSSHSGKSRNKDEHEKFHPPEFIFVIKYTLGSQDDDGRENDADGHGDLRAKTHENEESSDDIGDVQKDAPPRRSRRASVESSTSENSAKLSESYLALDAQIEAGIARLGSLPAARDGKPTPVNSDFNGDKMPGWTKSVSNGDRDEESTSSSSSYQGSDPSNFTQDEVETDDDASAGRQRGSDSKHHDHSNSSSYQRQIGLHRQGGMVSICSILPPILEESSEIDSSYSSVVNDLDQSLSSIAAWNDNPLPYDNDCDDDDNEHMSQSDEVLDVERELQEAVDQKLTNFLSIASSEKFVENLAYKAHKVSKHEKESRRDETSHVQRPNESNHDDSAYFEKAPTVSNPEVACFDQAPAAAIAESSKCSLRRSNQSSPEEAIESLFHQAYEVSNHNKKSSPHTNSHCQRSNERSRSDSASAQASDVSHREKAVSMDQAAAAPILESSKSHSRRLDQINLQATESALNSAHEVSNLKKKSLRDANLHCERSNKMSHNDSQEVEQAPDASNPEGVDSVDQPAAPSITESSKSRMRRRKQSRLEDATEPLVSQANEVSNHNKKSSQDTNFNYQRSNKSQNDPSEVEQAPHVDLSIHGRAVSMDRTPASSTESSTSRPRKHNRTSDDVGDDMTTRNGQAPDALSNVKKSAGDVKSHVKQSSKKYREKNEALEMSHSERDFVEALKKIDSENKHRHPKCRSRRRHESSPEGCNHDAVTSLNCDIMVDDQATSSLQRREARVSHSKKGTRRSHETSADNVESTEISASEDRRQDEVISPLLVSELSTSHCTQDKKRFHKEAADNSGNLGDKLLSERKPSEIDEQSNFEKKPHEPSKIPPSMSDLLKTCSSKQNNHKAPPDIDEAISILNSAIQILNSEKKVKNSKPHCAQSTQKKSSNEERKLTKESHELSTGDDEDYQSKHSYRTSSNHYTLKENGEPLDVSTSDKSCSAQSSSSRDGSIVAPPSEASERGDDDSIAFPPSDSIASSIDERDNALTESIALPPWEDATECDVCFESRCNPDVSARVDVDGADCSSDSSIDVDKNSIEQRDAAKSISGEDNCLDTSWSDESDTNCDNDRVPKLEKKLPKRFLQIVQGKSGMTKPRADRDKSDETSDENQCQSQKAGIIKKVRHTLSKQGNVRKLSKSLPAIVGDGFLVLEGGVIAIEDGIHHLKKKAKERKHKAVFCDAFNETTKSQQTYSEKGVHCDLSDLGSHSFLPSGSELSVKSSSSRGTTTALISGCDFFERAHSSVGSDSAKVCKQTDELRNSSNHISVPSNLARKSRLHCRQQEKSRSEYNSNSNKHHHIEFEFSNDVVVDSKSSLRSSRQKSKLHRSCPKLKSDGLNAFNSNDNGELITWDDLEDAIYIGLHNSLSVITSSVNEKQEWRNNTKNSDVEAERRNDDFHENGLVTEPPEKRFSSIKLNANKDSNRPLRSHHSQHDYVVREDVQDNLIADSSNASDDAEVQHIGETDCTDGPWCCSKCTFINENPMHLTCGACNLPRLLQLDC